jgi:hypothetical protein
MNLLLAIVLAVILPVIGPKESPNANGQQNNQQVLKKPSSSAEIKDQPKVDTNGASDGPKSYFSRLFSPENLPNIGLLIAGVIGIRVAVKTLKTLNKQTTASIDSERARIIPELSPMATHYSNGRWYRSVGTTRVVMSDEEILRGEHLRHGLTFTNMGRTVGQIIGYEIHFGFFDHKQEVLRIEKIRYNGDFDRMLSGSDTQILDEIIEINEFVNNPAAGVQTWKNWMVIIVSISYRHIFSGAECEEEVFRFVYDVKSMRMQRRAVTEADKKQVCEGKCWPRLTDAPESSN